MSYNRTHLERAYRSMFVINLNKEFDRFIIACKCIRMDSGAASSKYKLYVLEAITDHQKEINNTGRDKERKQTNFFLVHVNRAFSEAENYDQLDAFYRQARQAYLNNESEYYWSKDFKK